MRGCLGVEALAIVEISYEIYRKHNWVVTLGLSSGRQTRAMSNYSIAEFFISETGDGVGCAADLEGTDFLEVLAFEKEIDGWASEGGEGFRGENWGMVDVGCDEGVGGDYGGSREGEVEVGHCLRGKGRELVGE